MSDCIISDKIPKQHMFLLSLELASLGPSVTNKQTTKKNESILKHSFLVHRNITYIYTLVLKSIYNKSLDLIDSSSEDTVYCKSR